MAPRIIALLDSGVSLEEERVLPGRNFSTEGAPDDYKDTTASRHGSQVAETILRIAPDCVVLPVKVLDASGVLWGSSLEDALAWIADSIPSDELSVVCATIADYSHRTDDLDARVGPLPAMIGALRERGIPTVFPAGNWQLDFSSRGREGMAWPAILREAVSVGAASASPLGVAVRSQRLHLDPATGCGTTLFAVPDRPGDTSGAAAVAAATLAAGRLTRPDLDVQELVSWLLREEGRATTCYSGSMLGLALES